MTKLELKWVPLWVGFVAFGGTMWHAVFATPHERAHCATQGTARGHALPRGHGTQHEHTTRRAARTRTDNVLLKGDLRCQCVSVRRQSPWKDLLFKGDQKAHFAKKIPVQGGSCM